MNRENKISIIMEDERNRIEEQKVKEQKRQNEIAELRLFINSPQLAKESISDDFQTAAVPVREGDYTRVFSYDIPSDKAAIIKSIANDWYPGMKYDFVIDGHTVIDSAEREIAPTESPKEVRLLARDSILWVASNTGSEERNVGVVTGGHQIPLEMYERFIELYNKYDTAYDDLIEVPSETVEETDDSDNVSATVSYNQVIEDGIE